VEFFNTIKFKRKKRYYYGYIEQKKTCMTWKKEEKEQIRKKLKW
jgi:hypothetical protein